MQDFAASAAATQEEIGLDISSLFRGAIRLVMGCVLDQEVREMVGVRRYERVGSRKDHLNGTYLRRLLTSMGSLEIAVPRTRHSGAPSTVIGRYKRRTDNIDRLVTTAYAEGVSTRDMSRVTRALMGEGISRSAVSRVTKALGEKVEELRRWLGPGRLWRYSERLPKTPGNQHRSGGERGQLGRAPGAA